MIVNVVDNRKQRFRWKRVNAVAEPTWYDNRYEDTDQAESTRDESDYEERTSISVSDAIKWANDLPFPLPFTCTMKTARNMQVEYDSDNHCYVVAKREGLRGKMTVYMYCSTPIIRIPK